MYSSKQNCIQFSLAGSCRKKTRPSVSCHPWIFGVYQIHTSFPSCSSSKPSSIRFFSNVFRRCSFFRSSLSSGSYARTQSIFLLPSRKTRVAFSLIIQEKPWKHITVIIQLHDTVVYIMANEGIYSFYKKKCFCKLNIHVHIRKALHFLQSCRVLKH